MRNLALASLPLADVSVVIPAFNEEGSLGEICRDLQARGAAVFVVDDGSRDATSMVARQSGAAVIHHATTMGKGAAIKSGLRYAVRSGASWVAFMDGDGQHATEDLERLLTRARRTECDVVLGERAFTRAMPMFRRWTNRIMSSALRRVSGLNVKDSQCGLRLWRADAVAKLSLTRSHFEVESEMLLAASRCGLRVAVAPIPTRYQRGRRSRIAPWRDTVRWLIFFIPELWRTVSPRAKPSGRSPLLPRA